MNDNEFLKVKIPRKLKVLYEPKNKSNQVSLYEKKLKKYFNAKFALSTSSGTAAIILALQSLNLKKGDEVITSPIAPLCTAFPILFTCNKIKFSDVSRDNFGLCLESLKKNITSKTKAVIEVPMWGYPTRVKELRAFLNKKGIPLILDLALSPVAKYKKKYLFEYGDISCFSTQKSKIFSTGEGGYILTNNKNIYHDSLMYSRMGELNGKDFGLNFKLSEIQAKVGIKELNILDESIKRRTENANYISSNIRNNQVKELNIIENGTPCYQRLIIQVAKGDNKKLLKRLTIESGIPSDILKYNAKPLYEYPILAKYKNYCPNANYLLNSITTIPVHYKYRKKDLKYIINILNDFEC